jgi:hypothetical protein
MYNPVIPPEFPIDLVPDVSMLAIKSEYLLSPRDVYVHMGASSLEAMN